jgi:uncharacterized protein (DUF433 family)
MDCHGLRPRNDGFGATSSLSTPRSGKITVDHVIIGVVYMSRITLEPGKRGGRPCIRGLRITVYDVLSMLSSGMSQQEIQDDFPELTHEDILAALAYAAEREHQIYSYRVQ